MRYVVILKRVQHGTTKMRKSLDLLSYEERSRELGLFNLKKELGKECIHVNKYLLVGNKERAKLSLVLLIDKAMCPCKEQWAQSEMREIPAQHKKNPSVSPH